MCSACVLICPFFNVCFRCATADGERDTAALFLAALSAVVPPPLEPLPEPPGLPKLKLGLLPPAASAAAPKGDPDAERKVGVAAGTKGGGGGR